MNRILLLLLTAALPACIAKGTYVPGEEEIIPPPEGMTLLQAKVNGLSGLCYNKDKTGFYAVSDKDGVYTIDLAGTTATRVVKSSKDLEAVTIDFSTGKVYVAEERERKIYLVSGNSLQEFMTVTMPYVNANDGLESLACDQRGNLWIGNQQNPKEAVQYAIATQSEIVRYTSEYFTYYKHLSDFSYDTRDNSMWIVDSNVQRVYHCRMTGQNPFWPYEYQSVAFMGADAKPEALLVDSALGYMWVGDDVSGKIYKVPIATTPIP